MSKRVFLNSLPKSGTNLLSEIIERLGYHYSGKSISSGSLYGRRALIKRIVRSSFGYEGIDVGVDIETKVSKAFVHRSLNCANDRTYLSAHVPYNSTIHDLIEKYKYQTVYIMRDPFDVVVSWCKYVSAQPWHYSYNELRGLSLDDAVLKVLAGYKTRCGYVVPFNIVIERSIGWMLNKGTIVFSFEELRDACLREDFSNLKERIDKIPNLVSYDDKILSSSFGASHTFREGNIGRWENVLSKQTRLELFKNLQYCREKMGYTAQ